MNKTANSSDAVKSGRTAEKSAVESGRNDVKLVGALDVISAAVGSPVGGSGEGSVDENEDEQRQKMLLQMIANSASKVMSPPQTKRSLDDKAEAEAGFNSHPDTPLPSPLQSALKHLSMPSPLSSRNSQNSAKPPPMEGASSPTPGVESGSMPADRIVPYERGQSKNAVGEAHDNTELKCGIVLDLCLCVYANLYPWSFCRSVHLGWGS